MNYSLEDYEVALLNALSPLSVDNGGYLKTLSAYAGEATVETALEQFLRGFPGLLVLIQGADYDHRNYCEWTQTVKVVLLLGAQSWRSQNEARGDATGMAKLLADVRALLLGSRLGLEIRPVDIVREELIAGDNAHVLWWAEYAIINDNVTMEKI